MTSFPDLLSYSDNKTRVLILTSNPSVTRLILEVLRFYGKEFDLFRDHEFEQNENSDFVIFETSDLEKASQFKPNIFFMSAEMISDELTAAINSTVSGGVLIYPEDLADHVEAQNHFFRKLSFPEAKFKKINEHLILTTDLGEIPLISADESLIKNLDGIQLLCQQFGVMEEEFYEPVSNFH